MTNTDIDADTSVMQDRISQLCHQFKLPTMGAQSVDRFTASGHGDALPIFLEVLEQEACQQSMVLMVYDLVRS